MGIAPLRSVPRSALRMPRILPGQQYSSLTVIQRSTNSKRLFPSDIRPAQLYRLPTMTSRNNAADAFSTTAAGSAEHGQSMILTEIKVDHDNMRDLEERFKQAHASKDSHLMLKIVNTIIREASVHSDAEEMSIYKTLEQHGMGSTAEEDRKEHAEVKKMMAAIDGQKPDNIGLNEYAANVIKACDTFLHHAEQEEKEQLPALAQKMSAEDQAKATREFLEARATATTRPHPMAPQSGSTAQKAAEVMSKPMDAAAQAMREFVDLKHHHTEVGKA